MPNQHYFRIIKLIPFTLKRDETVKAGNIIERQNNLYFTQIVHVGCYIASPLDILLMEVEL